MRGSDRRYMISLPRIMSATWYIPIPCTSVTEGECQKVHYLPAKRYCSSVTWYMWYWTQDQPKPGTTSRYMENLRLLQDPYGIVLQILVRSHRNCSWYTLTQLYRVGVDTQVQELVESGQILQKKAQWEGRAFSREFKHTNFYFTPGISFLCFLQPPGPPTAILLVPTPTKSASKLTLVSSYTHLFTR
jgi:hypothetical protein